jgi:hypothetical protein
MEDIFTKMNIDENTKVYIIANNKNIDINKFKMIEEEDLIIVLNHSHFNENIKNHKKKVIFLRKCSDKNGGYWGYKKNFNNKYLMTFFIGNKITKKYEKYEDKKYLLKTMNEDIVKYTNYPKKYCPSTGFLIYNYIRNYFKDDNIFLFGFSFYDGFNKGICHNWSFEKKFCKNNNTKIIL